MNISLDLQQHAFGYLDDRSLRNDESRNQVRLKTQLLQGYEICKIVK